MNPNDPYAGQNGAAPQSPATAPTFVPPQGTPYAQQPQTAPTMQPVQPMQATPQPMQTAMQMPSPQPIQAPAQTVAPAKKNHIGEILLIILIFIITGAAVGGAIYCYTQYDALNREVLADRNVKVTTAKEEQKKIDEQNYEIRTAKTTREFTGPSNFGALTFEYPKEWNVYIDDDNSTKPGFAAYFSPEYAKPLNSDNQGLIFKINSNDYESEVRRYANNRLVSSQGFSTNGLTGTIISGKLEGRDESKNAVAVIIKVNNYSATITTPDYDAFGEDFDKIIGTLKSANYE